MGWTQSRMGVIARGCVIGVWIVSLLFAAFPVGNAPPLVAAASPDLVISQVYGGGGNTGATYKNDFIELFNRGASSVALTGYKVEYFSVSSGNSGGSAILTGSLASGQYFLIGGIAGAGGTADLPATDATIASTSGTTNLSAAAGRIDLTNAAATLIDRVGYGTGTFQQSEGSPAPAGSNTTAVIRAANGCTDTDMNNMDFATGAPNPRNTSTTASPCVPAGPAPTISAISPTMGIAGDTVTITGTNFSTAIAPTVKFGAATATVIADSVTSLTVTVPAGGGAVSVTVTNADNQSVTAAMMFTYTAGTPAPTITTISPDHGPIVGGTAITITGTNFAVGATVMFGTAPGTVTNVTATTINVTAPMVASAGAEDVVVSVGGQPATASHAFAYTGSLAIHDIQGAAHLSPHKGESVSNVYGVVTGLITGSGKGFYFEVPDADQDADVNTSEGVFVFTSSLPTVSVGNSVLVSGTVSEFIPGGMTTNNLTTTELSFATITTVSSTVPLPTPILVGMGGRSIPAQYSSAISGSGNGDLRAPAATSGLMYDATMYAVDFFESLEGMRVQVNNARAVGPRNAFNEIPVVPDDGAPLSAKFTPRGGVYLANARDNPQRLIFDDGITTNITQVPANVGDEFAGTSVGILDYTFGDYHLYITSLGTYTSRGISRETTTVAPTSAAQLTIANANFQNLSIVSGTNPMGQPQSKFDAIGQYVKNNLQSPDIITVEEVQDNTGPTDNGTVVATTNWNAIISAITAAGGPTYQFRSIDPVNDQDGGQPGGNIRVGFLFRTDRGVAFVDRPIVSGMDCSTTTDTAALSACATTGNSVVTDSTGTHLRYSPGRIAPASGAFSSSGGTLTDPCLAMSVAYSNSRKPLAGEFTFNGNRVFVVVNHLSSKGADTGLYERCQPPQRDSEQQRAQQAQVVHDFVQSLLSADASAKVVVTGDLNDFQFSNTLTVLKGTPVILTDLIETLPANEQYTYVYEGNSQVLDHILVSSNISALVSGYDVVHLNSEFNDQISDHDPEIVRLTLDVVYPVPVLTSLSANTAPIEGGTTLTLMGTGFRAGATVSFGGAAGTVTNIAGDGTTITVTTPMHGAGNASITVTNTDSQTSAPKPFIFLQSAMAQPIPHAPAPTVMPAAPVSTAHAAAPTVVATPMPAPARHFPG